MKLKYTKFKQRHILICSGLKKEGVNRKELDILYDPPEGLLRVIDYNETKKVITYDVGCCIPLKLYYKQKCFTEDEVMQMVKQLLVILNNMEKSRLTMQKLALEFEYVYFNITQAMLQVVFCPVQNNYSPLESEKIFAFLKDLVTNAVIIRDGSNSSGDKIQSFLLFLKKQQQFSAKAISVFFDDNYDENSKKAESVIEVPNKSNHGLASENLNSVTASQESYMPGFTSNSPEVMSGWQSAQASEQLSPTIKKPVPVSHTGFNHSQKSNNVTMQPVMQQTQIASPGDTIDTSIDDISKGLAMPGDTQDFNEVAYIRNDTTGIEYELPLSDCIIGRAGVDGNGNPVTPDLVVTENMRVSKHHAMITYDGSSYYISDMTGKNKTRVNNQVIETGIDIRTRLLNGKKVKIENGTKIQLASEGYTFIIKEI